MYRPIAVSLLAAILSQSIWIVMAVAITAILVLAFRERELFQRNEQLIAVDRALSRGGHAGDEGSTGDRLQTLIWQSESLQGLGSDVRELGRQLAPYLAAIRFEGPNGCEQLLAALGKYVRARSMAMFFSMPSVVEDQFFSRRAGKSLHRCLQYVREFNQETHGGLRVCIWDLHSESVLSHLAPLTARYLLTGYEREDREPEGAYMLVVALEYPEGCVPLPREREILTEFLRLVTSSLREHFDLKGLSSSADEERRRQEQYFAHISHDIRTPLNNIQAVLDLLFLEGITDSNKGFLKIARANCRSLRDIVEELLEFTKYRDGNLKAHFERTDPVEIIREVIQEFALSAEVKGLELSYRSELREGIEVDRKQLKRILMNLISNAIKYTERGRVEVTTTAHHGVVRIVVSDTGIGIPADKLNNLFLPFSRIGEVKAEGIGLGLTLTKALVQLNRGSINLHSKHGEGSQCLIEFPSCGLVFTKEEQAGLDEESRENYPNQKKWKILIVDDDRHAGLTMGRILAPWGYESQSICDISEVRGVLNFWRADLVITDVLVPGGGAEAVLAEAISFGVPVIAVTGCMVESALSRLQMQGIRQILRKPVDPIQLKQTIRSVLEADRDQTNLSDTRLVAQA